MGKQNAAALRVLWCPLFWFYAMKLCFTVPASREEGKCGNVECRYGPIWFLGSFGCCVSSASTRRSLLCMLGVQVLHKLNSSERSEKCVPISFKYCTPLGKILELASLSTAVALQYANACLSLLWGLQDVFPPPPCPLASVACNTLQPCSTFAGPFASICQKMLAIESLLLRLHGNGPQLHMQDTSLVCATQCTKSVLPLDPVHFSSVCWMKCVVCTLV